MSQEPDIPHIGPRHPRHRMRGSFTLPAAGVRRASGAIGTPFRTSPLRLGLFAALVVALVIAAGTVAVLPSQIRNASAKADASPQGARAVAASVGTIDRTLVFDGLVVREPDEELRIPSTGTITSISVQRGDDVTAGTTLAVVTLPAPSLPSPSPLPSPLPSASPSASASPSPSPSPSASPTFVFTPPPVAPEVRQITAPINGVVEDVAVVLGQFIRSGRVAITLAPNKFDVIAPVQPQLLFEFFQPPLAISATIPNGPSPFDCAFVSIGDNLSVTGAATVLTEDVDLRCSVPASVDVFPGVRVKLSVTTDEAANVVVVPVRAVQVHGETGFVWVLEKGHRPVRRSVQLGISDGRQIEISGGLQAGERVLDPAPRL